MPPNDPSKPSAPLALTKVRVRFPRPQIADVEQTVREELTRCQQFFPQEASIAVAVGSRGVANLSSIVGAAVIFLKERGAKPFIVPAMGSHGGATAEGQRQLLADYGVTEGAMGCPIRASMEVIELDQGALPHRLFMDQLAFASDGVLLINRIKSHTDFHGPYESGLVKMAVIGLGKERQALEVHRFGARGLRDFIPRAAEKILATGKILAGLGVVENAYDETAVIEAVPASELLAREPQLLDVARRNMARLPVDAINVLIVDRLGKNISGTGMDTNVIGRLRISGEAEPESPRIKNIVVTDLTDESHGNATGTGLADVVTRRLFDKIDFGVTYKNVFTSGFLERGKVPIVSLTDAEGYACALRACGPIAPGQERVARIRDTLHLGEIYLSPALCSDVRDRVDVELVGGPVEMFDTDGSLRPF